VGKLHYYPTTRDYALSTGFDLGLLHDAAHLDDDSDYVAWLKEVAPEFASRSKYRARNPIEGGNPNRSAIPEELHETTWCGVETRKMLEQLASQDKPFFLFSSYWRPHAPFEVPEPWCSMYDDVDIPLPEQVGLEHIHTLPLPVQKLILRGGEKPYEADRETLLWQYRSYYAAITQIDHQVGLTLDALEQTGLADNTIVVFCSDHGDELLEHGMGGKNVFFESSVHVPFIIGMPGRINPGRYDDLIESTDVFSTLFELCGLDVPRRNQGRSFAQRIAGVGSPYQPRECVICENVIPEVISMPGRDWEHVYEPGKGIAGVRHPDAKMVRTERYKYCYYVGNGHELYDLANDPDEMHNLADDPAHQPVVNDMRRRLLDYMITCDEPEQIAPRWCGV